MSMTTWTVAYQALHPWDFPGKSTGVGFHFLLQCMHACYVASVVSDSVQPYGQHPTRLLCPRDSLGKNIGVGCHVLFQGIFTTQGSNLLLLGLLHW